MKQVKPAPPPQNGQARQLEEPVLVGEITAAQAREIKALNELLTRLEQDFIHAQQVFAVAQMHRQEYLRRLLVERDIDPKDIYDIDSDSGRIMRTHEAAVPAAESVTN